MASRSPNPEKLSSHRSLARVRVYPTGQEGQWLVVGAKRDIEVTARSFFRLLNEVRKARRAAQ